MKKINKNTIILALSLILCFTVSIGIATAYFTDYESAKGGAVLNLSGQTQLEETVLDNSKTVHITNVGETDMIVRVRIIGDAEVTVSTGWIKKASENGDIWWYYGKILTPKGTAGAKASDLKAEVTGPAGVTNFDIVVVHEASRTVYNDDGSLVVPNGWNEQAVGQIALQ